MCENISNGARRVTFWGLTAERHFSKMTALGVASRCSRAAAPHVCVGTLIRYGRIGRSSAARFCFSGKCKHQTSILRFRSHGFMTALTRDRISAMRQTGEDQFGASWTARGRGVEAGAFLPPRLSARGSRDSKQHQAIEKTGAGAEMRGRTP